MLFSFIEDLKTLAISSLYKSKNRYLTIYRFLLHIHFRTKYWYNVLKHVIMKFVIINNYFIKIYI